VALNLCYEVLPTIRDKWSWITPANETSHYQFAHMVQSLMRGFGLISGILLFQKPPI
jgi:hypothetical protein